MKPIQSFNLTDDEGLPAGGVHVSPGCTIAWQNGPLGRGEDRQAPNGAFVENVIQAALERIEWYQTVSDGRFACPENALVITHLQEALSALNARTRRREVADIEGTHAEECDE